MEVPVSHPFIGEKELAYVEEAVKSGFISGTAGKFISEFERKFAAYCGAAYGVATSNGTVALHLAMATLGIGPGDEVLVSTFTNMATFFAILYQGATPVPVDIEEDTWNLNPNLLEGKLTPRTKGIVVVHVYGHPVDMDPVLEIAKRHGLFVVEDAAEAHGAEYKGKKAGSLGDIGCFSFYANKIVTTGEGGMLVTDNKAYAEKARSLGSLAYGKGGRFMHEAVGFNYRMTNVQAAIGCAQLEHIEKVIASKRRIAAFYGSGLKDVDGLQLPVEKPYARNVYWMYHIVLRGKLAGKRAAFMKYLADKGIDTRPAFIPFNMQRIFIEQGLTKEAECPAANNVAANGLYLPSGPVISEEELAYVVQTVKEAVRAI